jgi:ComF family protein
MGRDLIHAFKFRKKKTLLPLLSRLMIEGLSSYPDLVAVDLVLPVPLHRRVERERGFNQSALLGKMVADEKGLPFSTGVIRKIKPTPPQSSLGREERKKAVTGAFAAKNEKRPLAGKKVLLIDDVLTTGATANECARVILAAGAKEVFVFTLARTPYRI